MTTQAQPSSQPSASPPVYGGTYDDLKAQYTTRLQEYNALIDQALATNDTSKLSAIRAKATEITTTLNKMVEALTYLKKETPSLRTERDILLEKLRRIQTDYGVLVQTTDDLETLRRIRREEGGTDSHQLVRYLAFFVLLSCAMILFVMLMGGRQKTASTATTPSNPAMSPAFT